MDFQDKQILEEEVGEQALLIPEASLLTLHVCMEVEEVQELL
jgi:hypothetical protein